MANTILSREDVINAFRRLELGPPTYLYDAYGRLVTVGRAEPEPKIGDAITVRKPRRFRGSQGA